MAAHDDKISTNRRRLFKALSSVPVVMTLRPGSALANTSAYQCVTDIAAKPDPVNLFHPNTMPGACSDSDLCYAYQERKYWDVSGCGYPGTPAIVVETQPGVYVTGDGFVAMPTFASGALTGFTVGGTPYTCASLVSQQGLFLVVGTPTPDAVSATGFQYTGVYPQQSPSAGGQMGITGTCLNSVPNSVGSFTIAKG